MFGSLTNYKQYFAVYKNMLYIKTKKLKSLTRTKPHPLTPKFLRDRRGNHAWTGLDYFHPQFFLYINLTYLGRYSQNKIISHIWLPFSRGVIDKR